MEIDWEMNAAIERAKECALAEADCSALERLRRDVQDERLPVGTMRDVKEIIELAEIGKKWRDDSSLETLYPFSARELEELRTHRRLLQNLVAAVEGFRKHNTHFSPDVQPIVDAYDRLNPIVPNGDCDN